MADTTLLDTVNTAASAVFLLSQYSQHVEVARARAFADELRNAVSAWIDERDGSVSPRTHTSPRAPQLLRRSPLRKVACVGDSVLSARRRYATELLKHMRALTVNDGQRRWLDDIEAALFERHGMLSETPDQDALTGVASRLRALLRSNAPVVMERSRSTPRRRHTVNLLDDGDDNDNDAEDGAVTRSSQRNRPRSYSFIL